MQFYALLSVSPTPWAFAEGPSLPTPRHCRRTLRLEEGGTPIGEPGAPRVVLASTPMPGIENRTTPPTNAFSFWNVGSGPRIPSAPQSLTTLSALQSDVSCWASGSDYPLGEGAAVGPACSASSGSGRLVLVFRRGPAAPGSHFLWRLSHSPRDPRTPQAVGTVPAQERWAALPPAGAASPHARGGLACRMLGLVG